MISPSIDVSKIHVIKKNCIALLAGSPNVDYKMLADASGGKISKESSIEPCQALVNFLEWIEPDPTTKKTIKRGRKKGENGANGAEAAKGNGSADPNAPKKRRGRRPKAVVEAPPQATEAAPAAALAAAETPLEPSPAMSPLPDAAATAEPLPEA